MDFHRVTATADPLYAPAMALYRASFPSHEQRQTASQEAILSHPDYHFLVLTEQGAPRPVSCSTGIRRTFAISNTLQSPCPAGSLVLAAAPCKRRPRGHAGDPEIDPLTTDIAVRRKRFYERLGFLLDPSPPCASALSRRPDRTCAAGAVPGRRRWRRRLSGLRAVSAHRSHGLTPCIAILPGEYSRVEKLPQEMDSAAVFVV